MLGAFFRLPSLAGWPVVLRRSCANLRSVAALLKTHNHPTRFPMWIVTDRRDSAAETDICPPIATVSLQCFFPWSVEQRRRVGGRRGYEAQVLPARAGGDPAARRPGEEAVAGQERPGYYFNGLRFLPDRDGEGGQAHGAAAEPPDQGVEHPAVEPVKGECVHLGR